MTFGERLKEKRTAKGLTGKQLADKLRIGKSYVSQWECGIKPIPRVAFLEKIADELDCSVDYLIGRKER